MMLSVNLGGITMELVTSSSLQISNDETPPCALLGGFPTTKNWGHVYLTTNKPPVIERYHHQSSSGDNGGYLSLDCVVFLTYTLIYF